MSIGYFQSRLIVGDQVGGSSAPQWLMDAYREFHHHVTDPDYPCFFGTRAEQAGHLYYTYCEHTNCARLPASILTFIRLKRESRHFDTNLAVFLSPESDGRSHEYYRDRLWALLRHLHICDPVDWPKDFESDPEKALWEFAFGGEQFFIFCASPSYRLRRSRNLGRCQILMMQPRSSFSVLEGNANGTAVRARVRQRIAEWDDVGVHPDLGAFGDPRSREWKQYFLPDDMEDVTGKCPFRHRSEGRH